MDQNRRIPLRGKELFKEVLMAGIVLPLTVLLFMLVVHVFSLLVVNEKIQQLTSDIKGCKSWVNDR